MSTGNSETELTTDREHTKSVHIKAENATVEETDDGDTRVTVPVSGLGEDRDGDRFSQDGINALVEQINSESIPMFPNHGLSTDTGGFEYRFQDMMGRWEAAEEDGDVVQATAVLRENDPNADELRDLLDQDMPVGFSVGFGWDEADAEERDTGGFEFHDADLMEVSPVGIPSHPNAVVQAGAEVASAMKRAGVDPADGMDGVDITVNMSNDEQDSGEATEEEVEASVDETDESETDEQNESDDMEALSEDQLRAVQNSLQNSLESHMNALVGDVIDSLAEGDVETNEEDDEEDEEEETEASDGEDEDDEEDEKVAELRSELEEVRAELEAVKSDSVGAAERKGGMVTADKGESEQEDKDGDTAAPEEFAADLV